MSDSGLRGLRRYALALPVAALPVALLLGATNGGAQPGGTYCDAAYRSSNGTFLDGKPIGRDYVSLADVHKVSFGNFEMEVVRG